jgi:beta-glucanase (GH16 family)
MASEDSRALAVDSPYPGMGPGQRGSMVLYRLANEDEQGELLPPPTLLSNRASVASSSGDSIFSLSSDSKYPSGITYGQRGLVPYAYDPDVDDKEPPDEEDLLHDPEDKRPEKTSSLFAMRGFMNVGVLLLLILGLLCLFIFYPVLSFIRNNARNLAIDGNIRINGTGQAPALVQLPQLIDLDTPDSAKTRQGFDGEEYELVFSDEFSVDGRTFYPGDDPYWEAVDLWYGATADLEWYDPGQITTRDGKLVITMENVENHGLQYKSGMLQSWNKFCFTSGYIEVSVTLPGPDGNTRGYWPGVWTMGNLGRPGYPATTDGIWPYTYDSCDVGTFPNQTWVNGTGPAAALHSDASRERYNYDLSWLPGQRLSSCTCPGEDHPGPTTNLGRGAPEIDIFEAEINKLTNISQVVSQSAQFAPYTHDYLYGNATNDQFEIFNADNTRANPYKGSAVQQAVSTLTGLPGDMFQGSGQVFHPLGFEYWADPADPTAGFITWQVDGQQAARLGATAVGPDQDPTTGSGVGQRLIPVEPMAIVLNLGISANWQTIDTSTMVFPSIMLVDYVRVYQRRGHTNVGCNPRDYPTTDYIQRHIDAYSNPNLTAWNYPKPRNGLYAGGC